MTSTGPVVLCRRGVGSDAFFWAWGGGLGGSDVFCGRDVEDEREGTMGVKSEMGNEEDFFASVGVEDLAEGGAKECIEAEWMDATGDEVDVLLSERVEDDGDGSTELSGWFSFRLGRLGFALGPACAAAISHTSLRSFSRIDSPASLPLGLRPRNFHDTANSPASCGTLPSSWITTLASKLAVLAESNMCRSLCEILVV